MKDRPIRVAILAFPASTASIVHGLYDLFHMAGRDYERMTGKPMAGEVFDPVIVAKERGEVSLCNGLRTTAHAALGEVDRPHIVCIPEVLLSPEESLEGRFEEEKHRLVQWHRSGALIASACTGGMLLAESGLLDGNEGTTHWAFCEVMQRRHPAVKVKSKGALVMTGEGQRLVMAGGGTSWLDLGLYLIARTAGLETAMNVARVSMIEWHHDGQQPFAATMALRPSPDAVVAQCQTWAAQRFHEPAPVSGMVALSGLPERSFARRFKQATGLTPLAYVHALRLEEARRMLEGSDEPVEAIALEVGYEDAGFFTRMFKRKVGLTPGQYRRRFGGLRKSLAGQVAN
ncbi:MAG: helix-turn-helix domain-containing protein [Flavobacteriales bacterium]|nr:helix-turn-helix domain-containing protein [Flavobacteriales bacterium]